MCDLSWIAGRSQNLVSHHTRTLRSLGMVRSRRAGKMVMYSPVSVEDLEGAVKSAGYGVAKTEEAERPPFWRTPRALSTAASALLFLAGLAVSVAGAPEVARVSAYLGAIAVGGLPIFRAAVAGSPPGHERADERGHHRRRGDRRVG